MTGPRIGFALALGLIMLTAAQASAYHPIPGFHVEARSGGSSRIYFTGSPLWDGLDCGACHIDAPKQVRFLMSSTPEDLFTTGRYTPGQTYRITIDVIGAEDKGLRTWMMESLDDDLALAGDYLDVPGGCTAGNGTARGCLQPSCNFMCKNGPEYKQTCAPAGQSICTELVKIPGCGHCSPADGCAGCVTLDGIVGGTVVIPPWQLDFIAPEAGTGPITLYFGGVAGTSDHTSLGDDYEMQRHRLCEGPSGCSEDPPSVDDGGDYVPPQSEAGCSVRSSHGLPGSPWDWLFGLAIVWCSSRQRAVRE